MLSIQGVLCVVSCLSLMACTHQVEEPILVPSPPAEDSVELALHPSCYDFGKQDCINEPMPDKIRWVYWAGEFSPPLPTTPNDTIATEGRVRLRILASGREIFTYDSKSDKKPLAKFKTSCMAFRENYPNHLTVDLRLSEGDFVPLQCHSMEIKLYGALNGNLYGSGYSSSVGKHLPKDPDQKTFECSGSQSLSFKIPACP